MEKMLRTTVNKISKCSGHQINCNLLCPALYLFYSSAAKLVLPTKSFKDKLKSNISRIGAFESVDCLKSLDSHQCSKMSEETKLILQKFKFLNHNKEKSNALYILHPDLADLMISKLGRESHKSKSVIFEINPGPGILTKKLLEAGFHKVKVFETKKDFLPCLLKLKENHPKQLQVLNMDLLSLPKKLSIDNDCEAENTKMIFEDVIVRPWSEDCPPMILVGTLHPFGEITFLRYLITMIATMRSIYSYGRAELLVFISGREIEYIFSNASNRFSTYRYATVMYRLFFDIEVLYKETRTSFYPPQRPSKRKKQFSFDSEHLYLVKIIPKKNILNLDLPVNQFERFLYFVRHLLQRRSWPLIEPLRKWMSENEIYKLGYTKETRTGDLQPEEFMHLFKCIIKQADYEDSIFQLATNHNIEEDIEEDIFPWLTNLLLPIMYS